MKAKTARVAMVRGGDKSIYLPKAPEVLTKSMAKLISTRLVRGWFFNCKSLYLVSAKAFSLIISDTDLF